jgi:hypothetical protein
MTDCTYHGMSIHYRLWRWIIPVIVGGIAAGLWAGHHQPEPITCEPGTSPYAPMQSASPATIEPLICGIKIRPVTRP